MDSALVVEVFLGLWLVVLVLLLLLLVHFSQTILLLLRLVLTVLHLRLLLQLLGVQPPHLLLHELGVQKNQSLLHDLERLGHLLVVVLKLSENVLGLGSWQVDQQRLGCVSVKCRDVQIVGLGITGYLDHIIQIVLRQILHSLIKHNTVCFQISSLLDELPTSINRPQRL